MEEAAALGTLSVPSTPIASSPSSLVSNSDGQFALLTRNEINIFTPVHGVQLDSVSWKVQQQQGETLQDVTRAFTKTKSKARVPDLPVYRCTVAIEKKDKMAWKGWSVANATLSPAADTVEVFWRAVAWSPSGLSATGGCLLVALTSNHEVLVYTASKNAHKGPWLEMFDLTSTLARLLLPTSESEEKPDLTSVGLAEIGVKVLQCQATSIAWSEAVPGVFGDASLLVVGHKSGHISVWRHAGAKLEILHRYRLSDTARWITSIAWSPWQVKEREAGKKVLAKLAVGDSSGAVWVLDISQDVSNHRLESLSPDEDNMDVDADAANVEASAPVQVEAADRSPASQLKWVTTDKTYLLITKLGRLIVVPSEMYDASRTVEFPEGDRSRWMGSSPWAVCTGLELLDHSSTVLIALASADVYAVDISSNPILTTTDDGTAASSHLTNAFRDAFEAVPVGYELFARDPRKVTSRKVGAKVKGFARLGHRGQLALAYEADFPDDIAYRTNAMVRTTLVLPRFAMETTGVSAEIEHVKGILAASPNPLLQSPLATLQRTFEYLAGSTTESSVVIELFDLLPAFPPIVFSASELDEEADSSTRLYDLLSLLFQDSSLENLRLRETIIRFMLRNVARGATAKQAAGELQRSLLREIARQIAGRLADILAPAEKAGLLSDSEKEATRRLTLVTSSLSSAAAESSGELEALPVAFDGREFCPACKTAIPFDNFRVGRCAKGHAWERCTITLQVMTTLKARTCIGCERKALVDFPRGSFIDSILKSVPCCLYCSGRWMRFR